MILQKLITIENKKTIGNHTYGINQKISYILLIGRVIKLLTNLTTIFLIIKSLPLIISTTSFHIFNNSNYTVKFGKCNNYFSFAKILPKITPLTLACINPLVIPAPSPPT